jgi:hypothetical protein
MRSRTIESPAVTCTLGSADHAAQAERWRRLYADAGSARIVTADGLRVRFRRDSAVEQELRALVAVEVGCCAWADWTVEQRAEELVLEVRSAGAGIQVIHGWFLEARG